MTKPPARGRGSVCRVSQRSFWLLLLPAGKNAEKRGTQRMQGSRGGKHIGKRTISLVLASLVVFTLLSLYQWVVGRTADVTANRLTSRHPLAASIYSPPEPARAFSVIVPRSKGELGSPVLKNSGTAILEWATNEGGAAADALMLQEVVTGVVARPLVVTGISASDVKCSAPLGGTFFAPVGAGPLPGRLSLINLDSKERRARPQLDLSGKRWAFPRQVSQAEAERFAFIATTNRGDCTFNLAFHYRDGESERTLIVDDHGKQFRVSSSSAATSIANWEISGDSVRIKP